MQHADGTSEQPERCFMMLEQGPGAPAIERPDRGDPRRHAIEVPAEMIEDLRGNELNGVEGTAGRLEEADREGERQPVQGSPAFSNRSQLALVESEEMLDLECRQRRGNPSSPRYRCSHRLIGPFFSGLATGSGIAAFP